MTDILLFIALPFLAATAMLIGSVYIYRRHGMMVTSLSTQFLESRELFFGSLLMHWSLIILFFGHLAGFLFPGTLLAWNGDPTRLLILEGAALVFGIFFLTGMILLIIRRLRNQRLIRLTSSMDIVVFLVLLVQAVTGIWIATGYRWGSSWFASVLAPYLKSLLFLNPDLAAVSALPVVVKVHIATAFLMIGLIPFSRFIHFLVFPFSYFRRPYQVVLWNRDRKMIRRSESLAPLVKPKNS